MSPNTQYTRKAYAIHTQINTQIHTQGRGTTKLLKLEFLMWNLKNEEIICPGRVNGQR